MAPKRKQSASAPADASPSGNTPRRRSPRLAGVAASPAEKPPKKKAKAAKKEKGEASVLKKTIVVEYCKESWSFKKKALEVKMALEGLEDSRVNVVVVSAENPRRGCFEIREEGDGGEVFVSLLGLKRHVLPLLKALHMDKLISDIVKKIKRT